MPMPPEMLIRGSRRLLDPDLGLPPLTLYLSRNPPMSATPNYLDTAPFSEVRQIRWTRGRQLETETFKAGTCEIVIGNSDGTWDPDWSGSPLFGYLDIATKMQVGFTRVGQYKPQITAFIESIREGHPDFTEDVATIKLVDGFSPLSLARLTAMFNTEELSGTRLRKILDHADVAWPGTGLMISSGFRDLDDGELLMQLQEADDTSALELISQVVDNSERGMFFFAADGAAKFIERGAVLDTPEYSTSQAVFGDDQNRESDEVPYVDFRTARDALRIRNRVTAQRQGGAPQIAEELTSISKYFRRDEPMPEQLLTTDNDSYDVAAYEAFRRSTSLTHVEPLVLNPHVEPAKLWPIVLSDILQYRYTVRKRREETGQVTDYPVRVEGMDTLVKGNPGHSEPFWTTTLTLSLADPNKYWLLNDQTTGKLTQTARWSP